MVAALIGVVAVLLVALVVSIYANVQEDSDALVSALVGAPIGIFAALLLWWISVRRRSSSSSDGPWDWLIALGAASGMGWALLAPTWEAGLLGFVGGFLLAWIAVVTLIAVSIRD